MTKARCNPLWQPIPCPLSDIEGLESWLGDKEGLLSWKLDGLTINLTYDHGQLIQAAKTLPQKQLIVATDRGIFYKMQQACPDKELFEAPTAGEGATCRSCAHCPWMAMNELDGILHVLQHADQEIHVDPALAERAKLPLDRMLNFSASLKR